MVHSCHCLWQCGDLKWDEPLLSANSHVKPSAKDEDVIVVLQQVLVAKIPAARAAHDLWRENILSVTGAESHLEETQTKLATHVLEVTGATASVESARREVAAAAPVVVEMSGDAETEIANDARLALVTMEDQLAVATKQSDISSGAVASAQADLDKARASLALSEGLFKSVLVSPDRCDMDSFSAPRRRDIAAMKKTQTQGSNNRLSMFGSGNTDGNMCFKTKRGIERVYHGIAASSPLAEALVNKPQSHPDIVKYKGSRGPCTRYVLILPHL
jgi:hypothetical protein